MPEIDDSVSRGITTQSAFGQGYDARREGVSRLANPFEAGSFKFTQWRYGWKAAERQERFREEAAIDGV